MLKVNKVSSENLVFDIIKEYVNNSTLHGYRYLNEEGRHWIERLFWIVVHVIGAWGVTTIILNVWVQFQITPTVTTVHSTNYPIWEVKYPSVAICDNNKISRKEAIALSKELGMDVDLEKLKYLGRLYDLEEIPDELVDEVERYLSPKNYSLLNLMIRLAPKCDDILLRCFWKGQEELCSNYFQFRKTMDGYCCTFNFLRNVEQDEIEANNQLNIRLNNRNEKQYSTIPGFEMGLTLVTEINYNDYLYPLEQFIGIKILIFNPHDFPDKSSGGLNEAFVSAGNEAFIKLSSTTLLSDDDIRSFPASKRGCWFTDELQAEFDAFYSYSDCIINCRLDSIATLCGCVPFFLPATKNIKICELRDNKCLSRYREKWFTTKPLKTNVEGLERENEESISCSQCLPTCLDTSYFVHSLNTPLYYNPINITSRNSGKANHLLNYGVIHLYFDNEYTISYMHSVYYYWYELLSDFGAICGLFVGLSLISAVEVVYFFIIRLSLKLYQVLWKNKKNNNKIYPETILNHSNQSFQTTTQRLFPK